MSAPVSGTEHVISHVLDMIADHYRRRLALHGAQVGVATITAARLYQRFLERFDPTTIDIDACYPQEAEMEAFIQRLFQPIDPGGAMARECWNDYRQKLARWQRSRPHFERFCTEWQARHRPALAALVSQPESVRRILQDAGAPLTCEELEPPISRQEYDFAVRNGHFIRSRFVLADLLYFILQSPQSGVKKADQGASFLPGSGQEAV
jgi:glycerol-1-phosphate dehydrogenase [NAD(P)+]